MNTLSLPNGAMAEFEVVFCDLDGTLVNTDAANWSAYEAAVADIAQFAKFVVQPCNLRITSDTLGFIVPGLSDSQYAAIIAHKELNYQSHVHKVILNEPLVNILQSHSKTKRTVLVTNAQPRRVETTLAHFRLQREFSDIVCRQPVEYPGYSGKYGQALQKLDVRPSTVLVFEDDPDEIDRAVAAGIHPEQIMKVMF